MPAFASSGWNDGWYVVPWQVTWRDLDAAGHVNNSVYFTWFETGRTVYWLDLRKLEGPAGVEFIVARAECDYVSQLTLGHAIEIATRIGEIRNSSFEFLSEIRAGSTLAARGRVVVVLFDWARNQKVAVPQELREAIGAFQATEARANG